MFLEDTLTQNWSLLLKHLREGNGTKLEILAISIKMDISISPVDSKDLSKSEEK